MTETDWNFLFSSAKEENEHARLWLCAFCVRSSILLFHLRHLAQITITIVDSKRDALFHFTIDQRKRNYVIDVKHSCTATPDIIAARKVSQLPQLSRLSRLPNSLLKLVGNPDSGGNNVKKRINSFSSPSRKFIYW